MRTLSAPPPNFSSLLFISHLPLFSRDLSIPCLPLFPWVLRGVGYVGCERVCNRWLIVSTILDKVPHPLNTSHF
jgi:hypothetical protein